MRLELTTEEVIFLTDKVENDDYGSEEQPVDPYILLRKLGAEYLDTVTMWLKDVNQENLPPIYIDVSEPELWTLRSKVSSLEQTQKDAFFGMRLLCKIYAALINPISDDKWIERQMTRTNGATMESDLLGEVRILMKEWEAENATNSQPESEAKDPGQDPSKTDRSTEESDKEAGPGAETEVGAGEDLSSTEGPSDQTYRDRPARPTLNEVWEFE